MPGIPAGEPDNATGAGQTLPVTLAPGATKLSLIGTATQKDQDTAGDGALHRRHRATSYPIQYGDWCGSAKFGNAIAVRDVLRGSTARAPTAASSSCSRPLRSTIPAGKTVESVTLPTQTGDPHADGRIHVFAVADNGTPLTVTPATGAHGEVRHRLDA